jgi:hypothetical protein
MLQQVAVVAVVVLAQKTALTVVLVVARLLAQAERLVQ